MRRASNHSSELSHTRMHWLVNCEHRTKYGIGIGLLLSEVKQLFLSLEICRKRVDDGMRFDFATLASKREVSGVFSRSVACVIRVRSAL